MPTKEDAIQQLERERFKSVYLKIDSNYELTNKKIDANHNEVKIILNQILDQTKRTNGRVTKIEDVTIPLLKEDLEKEKAETSFIRFMTKNKKVAIFSIIGVIALFFAINVLNFKFNLL